ncbi:MAG: redoxin [Gammaproteobacteria bacterium]|nr:MAG: redoxin [Gammaproteobacteria bacterium]
MSTPSWRNRAINIAITLLLIAGAAGVAVNHFYKKSLATTHLGSKPNTGLSTNNKADSKTQEPIKRPHFTLPDIDGIQRTVSTWDGKVLVVNFWASWCEPCLREIPAFVDLQRTYGEQGLQFIGIAVEDIKPVREFLKKIPINYPILVHPRDTIPVAEAYGNEFGILPFTVVVNRDGNIAHTQLGAISHEEAEEIIKALL